MLTINSAGIAATQNKFIAKTVGVNENELRNKIAKK